MSSSRMIFLDFLSPSSFISPQNVVCFLILPFLVHKIFTFYINGVLNCKCPAPELFFLDFRSPSSFIPPQNVVCFLILPFLVHKIFTFYIHGILNCKCPAPELFFWTFSHHLRLFPHIPNITLLGTQNIHILHK